MKTLLILICTTLLAGSSFGANTFFYSINDGMGTGGNWNNGSYWSSTSGGSACSCNPGIGPKASDFVYIETDVTLNVNVASSGYMYIKAGESLQTTTKNLEIKSGGVLIVEGLLKVWDLTFFNGSSIEVRNGGQVIVLHNLTNMNNSDDVLVDGSISVTGEFYNGNGGIVSGSGSIGATTFTGTGTTFGHTPNNAIVGPATVTTGPLPVELISFTGKSNGFQIELEWTTKAEIQNDYFVVEKSADGYVFSEMIRVAGNGTSSALHNYACNDENPLPGNNYYRLIQNDFDGKQTTSEIIQISFSASGKPFSFDVYPNPAEITDQPTIRISGFETEKPVIVVVMDILGQELYSKVLITDNSGNLVEAIDLESRLSAGTYLIVGSSNNQTYNKYLIIRQ